MKVKDILAKDLTAVTPQTNISRAIDVMSKHRVSGLPVVNENFTVVGFISEKDIIEAAFPYVESMKQDLLLTARLGDLARELHKIGGRLVSDYMTTPALTAREDQDIEEVAIQMLARNIKTMPVVTDGQLIGVVRRRDLTLALIKAGETG